MSVCLCVCLCVCPSENSSCNSGPIRFAVVPIDSEFYRECPEQKKFEKRLQRPLAENENNKHFPRFELAVVESIGKHEQKPFCRKKLDIDHCAT